MIGNIVKAAANIKNADRKILAEALNISPQALSNKYSRDSFSGVDLIKIADACGYRLAFVDEQGKAVIAFPKMNKNEGE